MASLQSVKLDVHVFNSSFYCLYVLETSLESTWAMSKTFQRH